MVPLITPREVGKKLTCMVSDLPFAMVVGAPEKPVCEKGYVTVTPVTLNEVVPVLVIVMAWLVVAPRGWLAKFRDAWFRVAIAVALVPMPLIGTFSDDSAVTAIVALPL